MNDEIKEILDKLKDKSNYQIDYNDGGAYKELFANEIYILLDYITNLQQKEELFEKIVYKYDELKQENERLKEKIKYASDKLVGYINAPYVITNEYFEDIIRTIEENTDIQIGTNCMDFMEELEDYKSRCEKAVEYINNYSEYLWANVNTKELLDILNGRSDE